VNRTYNPVFNSFISYQDNGTRRNVVGSGTTLLVGRSWVRFPMRSLEILIDLTFPTPLWPWGSTSENRSRDSVVGIVTGYGLDDRVPVLPRIFFSSQPSDRFWGVLNLLSNVSPEIKRPGLEVNSSLSASVEVKKIWIYIRLLFTLPPR
jgi:hypothetical protein